jgi:hypothetical protein
MKVWTDAAEAGLLDRRGERGRDCGHLKGTASHTKAHAGFTEIGNRMLLRSTTLVHPSLKKRDPLVWPGITIVLGH